MGEKRPMAETIVWRKKKCIGHKMRGGERIKEVMEGKMEGKRRPDSKRKNGQRDDEVSKYD